MRILNIKIDTNTRNVISMTTDFLGMENDNLQTKLVVELTEDLPGEGRIDFEIGDEKHYAMMTKVDNKYELMLTNSMLSSSLSAIQLVISWTESDHTLTWKSKILDLHIEPSINADGEVPEEFESWLEILQTAINEANNLNISVNSSNSSITITKKDGTTTTTEIKGNNKRFIPGTTTFSELSNWVRAGYNVLLFFIGTNYDDVYRLNYISANDLSRPWKARFDKVWADKYTSKESPHIITANSLIYDFTSRLDSEYSLQSYLVSFDKNDYYIKTEIDTKLDDYATKDYVNSLNGNNISY